MQDDDNSVIGTVKHVGKQHSKKRNVCWVDVQGEIKEIDFLKDVCKWKYITKSNLKFDERATKSSEEDHKVVTENEAEGIFYLKRVDPINVYASEVKKR